MKLDSLKYGGSSFPVLGYIFRPWGLRNNKVGSSYPIQEEEASQLVKSSY